MSGRANGFHVYNSQLDAFSLYHLVQEEQEAQHESKSDVGPILPALGHAMAGAIAAALAKATVYPIETIVTRMQVQKQLKSDKETSSAADDAGVGYTSLLDAVHKIYQTEGGLHGFYPGLVADVSKGVVDTFLFFLAYTALRKYQSQRDGSKHLSVGKEIGVGIVAGCFSKAITTPIQNIVTRQQTAALMAARNPRVGLTPEQSDKLSIAQIAAQIHSEKGLTGFWSGYSAAIILTLNPAITFAADSTLHRLIPRSRRDNPPPALTFLLAALSKVVATSITYPVILAKSRAMAVGSGTRSSRIRGNASILGRILSIFAGQAAILRSIRTIYRTEGKQGLYAGLEGELLKGFLQHGLTMTLKENVHGGVIQAYYTLLKLSNRWPVALKQN